MIFEDFLSVANIRAYWRSKYCKYTLCTRFTQSRLRPIVFFSASKKSWLNNFFVFEETIHHRICTFLICFKDFLLFLFPSDILLVDQIYKSLFVPYCQAPPSQTEAQNNRNLETLLVVTSYFFHICMFVLVQTEF